METASDESLFSTEDCVDLSADFRKESDKGAFQVSNTTDAGVNHSDNPNFSSRPTIGSVFTCEIVRQLRPWTHHGRGGRPRTLAQDQTRRSVPSQIASKFCRFLTSLCEERKECFSEKIRNALLSNVKEDANILSISVPDDYAKRLQQPFKQLIVREKLDMKSTRNRF